MLIVRAVLYVILLRLARNSLGPVPHSSSVDLLLLSKSPLAVAGQRGRVGPLICNVSLPHQAIVFVQLGLELCHLLLQSLDQVILI